MYGSTKAAALSAVLFLLSARGAGATTLVPLDVVRGAEVVTATVRGAGGSWRVSSWDDIDQKLLDPGHYQVLIRADAEHEGESLDVPHCAGRERVVLDGRDLHAPPGPLILPLSSGPHEVVMEVAVSGYERRIACGNAPRLGTVGQASDGLGVLTFASPWKKRGGGRAVVYVPPNHDVRVPGPLLVGLHPWNGSMWTYAAYAQLLREARARDLLLLMPCGLGNSLYTADAEDEVMRAIAAVSEVIAVDSHSVSLWGASMGGAGATTIGFHHPDRFASITSFFGDSKYDLTTYVRSILPNEAAAHVVNALDVVDNVRDVPVWLIHGENDRTSPIRQSEMLAAQMQKRGFSVRFDPVPGAGHAGTLVARFLPSLVAFAVSARTPEHVSHVTYRSVRASDTQAYGVRITRTLFSGDAFVDIERREDGVHVLRAQGLSGLVLLRGALGTSIESAPPIVVDDRTAGSVDAHWEP